MARLVRHEATGPIKIDPATLPLGPDGKPKKIAVCACGLSFKFPICDGTHKQLVEQPGEECYYHGAVKELIDQPQRLTRRGPLTPPLAAPAIVPPVVVPPAPQ
jgi:CDGSH-type Zn-finger protein